MKMVFNKFQDLRPEHKEHVLCMDDKGNRHEADFLELDDEGTKYSFAIQYALDEEKEEVMIFESVDNVVAWAGIENILKGENKMELKVYYGGHSISDKGIVKLKLKTDFTQQEECGALYATLQANTYNLVVDGENCGNFTIDSLKIDKNFDTTVTIKGYYSDTFFPTLYGKIKSTSEEEMIEVSIERGEN